jgi:hypothetical protein
LNASIVVTTGLAVWLGAPVERFVADHVEAARLKAFDEMGEGHRAFSVAMRWLGPKLS